MPADPGEPDNDAASSNSASRRSRKCQVLFILGSGFDPSKQAAALAQEFRDEHEGLNFSKTATVIESADVWQSDDKIGFKKSVSAVVRKWCRDQAASFDPKRLLVGDYQGEDGRLFAVAGYFPRSKTSSSAGVLAEETQDTDSDGEPAELSDHAVDAESGSSKFSLLAEQFVATARRQFETARQLPPKRLMMAGGGVLILLVLVTVVTMFLPGGGSSGLAGVDPEPGTEASDGDDPSAVGVPQLAPPQFMIGLLRVYTPEPGFAVLVDGEPVRRADGEFVTTPCAITAEQGARTVTVFREGSFDLSRLIDVGEDSEVTLEPSNDGTGDGSDILRAPHLNAAVGEPIALTVLNSSRPEIDPYLTPDRLSIWFVGDRQEGRGIFVSTRLTPYHDFDEPRIISRSADLPATPSITDDSLYIVYAVPEKARLMSLARANPLAGFDSRDALRHSNSLAPTWTSSQMLGDGLRIYWVEETGDGQVRTLTSSRTKRTDDFGKTYKVELAGTHPCLSPDGLRQYTFNGKTLTRYRRTSPVRKFIEEATIAELELPNYQPSKRHRQFFVSSDEQWLFYSDEPQKSGDLFMVRISEGPQWGVAPRGKSIPAKRVIAAVTDPSPDPEMVPEDKPIPKPVDPRTIPLPYTSHWNIFTTLLNTRQYEEAEGLLRNAAANPELQKFSEQLTWDSADLKSIRDFWSRIDDIAAGFKTGETIRIGALRLEVTRFENGELIGKRGDVEVRKKLIELPSTELSGIFDAGVEKEDTQAQFLFAVMLAYDVQALERAREQRFERSGEFVATFRERQARRKLAQ
ncbi:MAG: hypothetical protein O3B86_19015, partial [Planctomycetota bacterium]|nr:hypothetical protein [Planctomycetota bacterium]